MIKISVGIAYEQNRPTGVASTLRAQFGFGAKSALKMHCTNIFFETKVITNHNTQLLGQKLFDRPTGVACALIAQFVFLVKSALKMRFTKVFTIQKLLKIKVCNFYVM